jgi:Phosphotransferase enzyme family
VTATAPAWFAPGFDDELTEWIDEALAARGEKRTGPVEEHRRWGIGLVAKVSTDAGQRWAKAVPDLFAVEGPLTAWLADRFPGDVPGVVALDADRAFTLYEHVDGPMQESDESVAAVARVAATLARLHRGAASPGAAGELLALGAADRRLAGLPAGYRDAVDAAEAEGLLDPSRAGRCRTAAERLPDLVEEVVAGPVGEGLVHGDFHHRNVLLAGSDRRPVVIDWTDGCVAHPWFDLPVWRVDLRRAGIDAEVIAVYLEAWSDVVDGAEAARLLEVTHTAGAAWHAWSYRRLLDGLLDEHRSDLGTIGAEWCEVFVNRSAQLPPRAAPPPSSS